MAVIKLNLGDVKGVQENGIYLLRLDDIQVKDTQNDPDGGQYLNCRWSVIEPEEWIGSPPIWTIHSLKESARFFLKKWLEALTQVEWGEDAMELDPDQLKSLFVRAVVTKSKDNKERDVARVTDWLPA